MKICFFELLSALHLINPMANGFENWRPYMYTPSMAAAILFVVVFTFITAFTAFQFYKALRYPEIEKLDRSRTLIIIPFIVGGVCEIGGCIARIVSSKDEDAKNPFIVQSVLLLVAPALFAATIYMTLGRIISMLNSAQQSLVPLRFLTKIFVFGDVLSFLMQGTGAGLMAAKDTKFITIGGDIIITGLFIQIGFFSVFIIVSGLFQYRVLKNPSNEAQTTRHIPSTKRNWQCIMITLFACSTLILLRCIVRAIEYIQGWDGYIISHEAFSYTLDLMLMFFTMVLLSFQDICGYFVKVGPQSRGQSGLLMRDSDGYDEAKVGILWANGKWI